MHTVELLLEPRLEADVRELWRRLQEAGLPSLAGHPHPTNRPHLTVITAASLTGLPPLPLPVAAELTGARFLGRALVLAVTPTAELLAVHGQTWTALSAADPWPAPPDWLPHVSLALKVPERQRPAALRVLATVPVLRGRCTAARSYDTSTRTVADLVT